MYPVIENKKEILVGLCVKYRVRNLELFGSAATSSFNMASSDIDFLVEFLPMDFGEHANSFFDLKEELETVFERRVDLVETKAISNPYFLEMVNKNRTLVYAD